MKRTLFTIFICCIAQMMAFSQGEEKDLVQFSGVVVTGDSLTPVPFTNLMIKKSYRGTVTDYYGFFTIVAHRGDVIEFSGVGFKKSEYKIPDSLKENRYSLIHILSRDTILLKETVIFPWPTKEQFKQAFINLKIPDDDLDRAQRNLALERLREDGESLPPDAGLSYTIAQQQRQSKLYYAGQLPPNNLLNPIAWASFIKAWKNGDFKKKDKYDKDDK